MEIAFNPFASFIGDEFSDLYNHFFWILIPIILTLIFMRLTCPGALYIFKEGSFLRKLKSLGTGLLIGFVCISILNLAEWISGTTVLVTVLILLLIYVLNKKGKLRETGKL